MFEQIISLENLFAAWAEFRKGKARKKDVAEFELELENNVFQLNQDLNNGSFKHGGYVSFYVCDPKRRHIHKASVRDRLLHHAVHRVIEPFWDRLFIFDSWSSRTCKGTHGAVKRLQEFGRMLSGNHTKTLWVLKLDVKKFFASVDHEILINIVQNRTSEKKSVALLHEIVESFSPGLPLGNLTSQLFANVYLDKLDSYVKHELKIEGYVRYVDDFVLIHQDRGLLVDCLGKISVFLQDRLSLKIHPEKIVLKTYASGVDYLGYACFPQHVVLRTKTKRRMFRKVNVKNFSSYCGILRYCRSFALRKTLAGDRMWNLRGPVD